MRRSAALRRRVPLWICQRPVGPFATRPFNAGTGACPRCLSLPYSRGRVFAVGKTPCSRASSAVAIHKRSEIGKRPSCALRHRLKRRQSLPRLGEDIRSLAGHRLSSSPSMGKRQTFAISVRRSHASLPKPHQCSGQERAAMGQGQKPCRALLALALRRVVRFVGAPRLCLYLEHFSKTRRFS